MRTPRCCLLESIITYIMKEEVSKEWCQGGGDLNKQVLLRMIFLSKFSILNPKSDINAVLR